MGKIWQTWQLWCVNYGSESHDLTTFPVSLGGATTQNTASMAYGTWATDLEQCAVTYTTKRVLMKWSMDMQGNA